jgi:ElaB/YqjD/DUF883 family membrane-anchored ribosome-binding protein
MLGKSGYSRAISADIGEINRRLRALESRLERTGGRTAASATQAADRVGDTLASAFNTVADRLRHGAVSMSDDATRIGDEAARLGNTALRRLADEVEHRPLVTLAVAVGVGILVGLASSQSARR